MDIYINFILKKYSQSWIKKISKHGNNNKKENKNILQIKFIKHSCPIMLLLYNQV